MRLIYVVLCLLLFGGIVILITSQADQNSFETYFCDVGQGDATLFQISNTQVLIDGGANDSVLKCLEAHMPWGDKTIEVIILTHPDKDHYGGLMYVLNYYSVLNYFSVPVLKANQDFEALIDKLESLSLTQGLVVSCLFSGDKVYPNRQKYSNWYLTIIRPNKDWWLHSVDKDNQFSEELCFKEVVNDNLDTNEMSLVIHNKYIDFDVLINGDAESPTQISQIKSGLLPLNVEISTAPHHGSKDGISESWLDLISPEVVIFSVGESNTYGHPHPEVQQLLDENQIKYIRTDKLGTISVVSDGNMWNFK